MSVFDTLRIAASGLTAQRLRMDVAASNLANADTTRTAEGGPYRPEAVVFQTLPMTPGEPAAQGVEARAIINPAIAPKRVYDPTHPDADAAGFVTYPEVDVAAELADMMGASRSYGLNANAVDAAKQMARDAIELGR